jgi:hypothetical protein
MKSSRHVVKHPKPKNPVETLANTRHEFGEHGGVNMSIEASTTFTAMHPDVLADMFHGDKGPDQGGCYLYGRHFNPTVYNLWRPHRLGRHRLRWNLCFVARLSAGQGQHHRDPGRHQ